MMKRFKQLLSPKQRLFNLLLCLTLVLPNFGASWAYAASLDAPTIQYIAASNTILIGSNSGFPNGSQAITIPDLATTLNTQGAGNVLADLGSGIWLLKAKIIINPTGQLAATKATINELRLESTSSNFINITALKGGYLLIDGIKVTSWDTNANAVDQNITDGRSYLAAQEGGRMDVTNSEAAFLGWGANEISGLAWRKRANSLDATSGATGLVQNSNIHDNYFGLFASNAFSVTVLSSQIHNNNGYGILARDDSESLQIGGNNVFSNASTGISISRQSQKNQIHDNQVHDHTQDGIVVEMGSVDNQLMANTVFNNRNGIALSQASNNLIQGNHLYSNSTGLQVEAKFSQSAATDNVATANQILSNTVESNTNYGIYLYSRADRNTIAGNNVTKNGLNGIYLKTGGNLLRGNAVTGNTNGLVILNDPDQLPVGAIPPLESSGSNNVVVASTFASNNDTGIRIMGGVNNRIGADPSAPVAQDGNLIESNTKDGIAIIAATSGAASTDNQVLLNTIRNNQSRGIYLNGTTTVRNRISQNSITGNLSVGIKVDGGAQGDIQSPVVTDVLADHVTVKGTAQPGVTVEVYNDPAGEGQNFLGTTTADGGGAWTFIAATAQNPKQITALAIDASGNTSAFSGSSGSTVNAIFTLTTDENNQQTIEVSNAGAVVTLPDIVKGLGISNTNLLVDQGNGVWQLNANLFIRDSVTLNVSQTSGVNELRLRSDAGIVVNAQAHAASKLSELSSLDATTSDTVLDAIAAANVADTINYASFVYLRTLGGTINLDGVKVYSWDTTAQAFDEDITNGRAYVLARYDSTLNINNAELEYLGSADTDSQGVSWRDTNDPAAPGTLRTRVTGTVQNSNFHHNYYGAYTSQAANMVFQGNQFHDNLRYGLTIRDFTNGVLVENNASFNNGSHGIFISRGCNNNTLRNNKTYNNVDPGTTMAHGIVIDPGSTSGIQQPAPALDNTLEGNESYSNEGYGLRLQNATSNQITGNSFHDGQQGISIEQGSTQNTIISNTLSNNTNNGIIVNETADNNILSNNTVNGNTVNGIYLHSNNNLVNNNSVSGNVKEGIALAPSGVTPVQNNQLISNTVSGNLDSGIDLRGAIQTTIQGNTVDGNAAHGIYLTANGTNGASQNKITLNIIRSNKAYGIKANGATTVANTWSANQIYGNVTGGISLSGSANGALQEPQLLNVVERVVTGKSIKPGVTIEIFADAGAQGQFFEGQTTAGDDGSFTFTLPNTKVWDAGKITAVAIDAQGNASSFSNGLTAPTVTLPTPTPVMSSSYLPLIQK